VQSQDSLAGPFLFGHYNQPLLCLASGREEVFSKIDISRAEFEFRFSRLERANFILEKDQVFVSIKHLKEWKKIPLSSPSTLPTSAAKTNSGNYSKSTRVSLHWMMHHKLIEIELQLALKQRTMG